MIRPGLFDKQGGDEDAGVPLLGVRVSAEVVAGHACAVVRQRYRNDGAKPIEAIYTFPLPTRAVLTAFSMSVGGRELEGKVREREEAFRQYDDAIARGDGGALLEQERPNVFTANVGNLLPGEETVIEIRYLEPVAVEEGAVRWTIPTLVAPRYVPGVPTGDRTAHGVADPTDRVPDADRISPPIGDVAYGLTLDLAFDLGVDLDVASPSHAIVVRREGHVARVSFAQKEVLLDRDVVVTAAATGPSALGAGTPIATAVTHRKGGKGATGVFALTIIPDLGIGEATQARAGNDVVFVLDRSGSMGGASMPEARTALKLCLRQLREGDRFNILAFDTEIESFASGTVPFTQATLERADGWLAAIEARGGTELLAPMLEAVRLVPDGIVLLLTDGEVGNEDEILKRVVDARRAARVYSFGIGTNVSDALLHALADKTGGAVEMIFPGERIDEKVVAQFARATAPRVTDVTMKTRGIDLAEMAPADPRPLVDGEPYSIFGTYDEPGRGAVEIRGKLGATGEAFYLEVPVDLAEDSDRPMVSTLWAQARIRDLERSIASIGTERRAEAMKDRIVKLAIEHGVSSQFTSFVVIEKRTADRRAIGQPETRVVPVNAPHGWSLGGQTPQGFAKGRGGGARRAYGIAASRTRSTGAPGAPPMMAPPPYAAAPPPPSPMMAARPTMARAMAPAPAQGHGAPPTDRPPVGTDFFASAAIPAPMGATLGAAGAFAPPAAPPTPADDLLGIFARQAASGLWEETGKSTIGSTAAALHAILRLGATTAHPVFGAQIKKALDALVAHLASAPPSSADLVELAFGLAWLLASGRRTRLAVETAAAAALERAVVLGNEPVIRARVEELATLTFG